MFQQSILRTARECDHRPQRSSCKVMFLHVSVILSMGGVCGRQTLPWADGSQADTPWADTPLGRHPPGRHPPGRRPLGRHPPGQTPPWPYASLGRHPPGRHPPGRQTSPSQVQPLQRAVRILLECILVLNLHKSWQRMFSLAIYVQEYLIY